MPLLRAIVRRPEYEAGSHDLKIKLPFPQRRPRIDLRGRMGYGRRLRDADRRMEAGDRPLRLADERGGPLSVSSGYRQGLPCACRSTTSGRPSDRCCGPRIKDIPSEPPASIALERCSRSGLPACTPTSAAAIRMTVSLTRARLDDGAKTRTGRFATTRCPRRKSPHRANRAGPATTIRARGSRGLLSLRSAQRRAPLQRHSNTALKCRCAKITPRHDRTALRAQVD